MKYSKYSGSELNTFTISVLYLTATSFDTPLEHSFDFYLQLFWIETKIWKRWAVRVTFLMGTAAIQSETNDFVLNILHLCGEALR